MKIENCTTCEVWFLNAKNVHPTEIHGWTVEVYGEHATNEGNVRKWRLFLKEGKNNCLTRYEVGAHLWSQIILKEQEIGECRKAV